MQIDSPEGGKIDESLYSRQLYVLGKDAMLKMASSNVLVIGLKGLGVEIAKNIALAGVKSLTIYDPTIVTLQDLSAQFFLSESDIGKTRADATLPKLSELNQYVPISVISDLSDSSITNFQVIVATETPLEKQLEINEITHANNIKFISADIRGLFGQAFIDFGEEFRIFDVNGEQPVQGIVSDIESDGTVSVLDDSRHGLQDGDYVKFTEVEGMPKLNDGSIYKVEVLGPFAFKIKLDPSWGTYEKGGIFTQVKVPRNESYEKLSVQLSKPDYIISDFAKFDRPAQYHLGFQALHQFQIRHSNELPRPHNEEDANELVQLTKDLSEQNPSILGEDTEVNIELIKELSYQARGEIPGMAAFYGGFIAQEALKACSGNL
ncbi:unnamed protein product [[Candida] boidinii]|nr:unnamed protein product [[Candida] boidinii]